MISPLMAWFAAGLIATAAIADTTAILHEADSLNTAHDYASALELYLKADIATPNDPIILRRIAGQYSQMIAEASTKAEKMAYGKFAVEFAERAAALDPENSESHLTLAICYGRAALHETPRIRMEYSRRIKSEAESAIELDPKNDQAWHVLGRWNYEMATLNITLRTIAQMIYGKFPDASLGRAAECFENAIDSNPSRVIHHVELGRTYLALERVDEAREQLKTGIELPARGKDDSESKVLARNALDSL